MVERLTQHPYSDARNTVVLALALWALGVSLAAISGALVRLSPSLLAALLVYVSGIATAAATLDARIAMWIASMSFARRVASPALAMALSVLAGLALALAITQGARALGQGVASPVAAALLVAVPAFSGLAAALALAWMSLRHHPARPKATARLAASRVSR